VVGERDHEFLAYNDSHRPWGAAIRSYVKVAIGRQAAKTGERLIPKYGRGQRTGCECQYSRSHDDKFSPRNSIRRVCHYCLLFRTPSLVTNPTWPLGLVFKMAEISPIIGYIRLHNKPVLKAMVLVSLTSVLMVTAAQAENSTTVRKGPFFLPSGSATNIVTVTRTGEAQAGITMLTEAVAVKETGPRATVSKFGEVYAFSPSFLAVHREQPTQIEFWNLQPDDEHDFALLGNDLTVLMYVQLPPLKKTSYIFTFHREGEIEFKCLRHQPEMSGQILVLPPSK